MRHTRGLPTGELFDHGHRGKHQTHHKAEVRDHGKGGWCSREQDADNQGEERVEQEQEGVQGRL